MSKKFKNQKSNSLPPVGHQFLKGESGNKPGRPKGAVSLKRITRQVALKKHTVRINGVTKRDTMLNLVIDKLIHEAACGNASMVKLKRELRARLHPQDDKPKGGLLVIPRILSPEEWTAQAERHNAMAREPGTYIDHDDEEWMKVVRGEPGSAFGYALARYHDRWFRRSG